MTEGILNQEYWEGIVRTADPYYQKFMNTGLCALWCQLALKKLGEDGLEEGFSQNLSTESPALSRNGLRFHTWIERTTKDGERFIADGTAGQISSSYRNGFYGVVGEAPEELRALYNSR